MMNLQPNQRVEIKMSAYERYIHTHFTTLWKAPPTNEGVLVAPHPRYQKTWWVTVEGWPNAIPIPEEFIDELHGPYCEDCGACWLCDGGDPCRDGGDHQWPANESNN